jgi:mono/diheme cytochrome c family protein
MYHAKLLSPLRFSPLLVLGLFLPAVGARQDNGSKKPEPAVSPAAAQFFETKVRPVLAENCFSCHGEKKQRGGLRLDSRAAILEGGDRGPALVPGQPEKSVLVKAVGHEDKDLKMPPDKKLSKEQVEALAQWVKMGAPWPGADKAAAGTRKGEFHISDQDRAHWAFQPVKRPAVPAVKHAEWVRNPIDAFILARLEAKGLSPNSPAARHELLRRVYYDLTGLPPTPQEVEAFVADTSPDAYEKLVERLLESPRYGEKWARHWLDLVRYAETNSFERDNPKPNVWRYRDYVIRAFNADKPYDLFLKEQLAGDELDRTDPDAIIATGYYRLGIWDDEPSDPLQARYDGLDDIVATTGQVMLGLTVDCARCHNHKIDPIAQKDYYRLLAFFHNINHFRNGGPTDERPIFTSPEESVTYDEQARALEKKRNAVQEEMTRIEKDFRARYEKGSQAIGTDLDDLTYKFYRSAWMSLPDFATLKHEDAGKLPQNLFDIGPRTRNEEFGFVFEGVLIVPQPGKYRFFLDSDDGSRLTVNGQAVITYDGIHGLGKVQQAAVELPQGRLPIKLEYFQNLFGLGLHVSWSGPGFEQRLLSAPEKQPIMDFVKVFQQEGASVLGKERLAQYAKLRRQLEALKKEAPPAPRALCVTEAGPNPADTFLLLRGNPHVKGDKVQPGFPSVFGLPEPVVPSPKPGATTTGRRLVLASWIASRDNPMTARVMVNRLWQHHFGRGIVRSPNDFGLQGIRPTHPELLDWLAGEFVASGWRMKAMHQLILTSNAYRMSSRGNPAGLAADPANELFWRFDMRRLSAEEIRDSILAASGSLNLKMFGPSIYPEIPKEVLAGQSQPGRGWPVSPPEEQNRRSIYVHVKRSLLLPILESFDLAEPDRPTPVRFSTTQPTQALGMLNGDFLNKQAKVFAKRLRQEAGPEERHQVRLALSLATCRAPTVAEVQRGLSCITALRTQDGASAETALDVFCLLVLNLNEFVYLD